MLELVRQAQEGNSRVHLEMTKKKRAKTCKNVKKC